MGYPSETHLKLKSREVSFVRNLFHVVLLCWTFAQSTAVILPCSLQNFSASGRQEGVLCRIENSRDLSLKCISDRYPILQGPADSEPVTLLWRHNGHDSVSNHQAHDCLLNRLFTRRSKKTSKLRVTGLCAGTSPVTGEFPAQLASYAENVSIWWCHHAVSAVGSSRATAETE